MTTTEVWFRNPHNYVRELVEEHQGLIAWERGTLIKRRIDPAMHALLHFGHEIDYRLLIIGEQGAAELRRGDTLQSPTAVYPVWTYSESTALLEELVTQPVGADEEICKPGKYPADQTPVFGQEHRVVLTGLPSFNTNHGRRFLAFLKELQEDYPSCILHMHGQYSWRIVFGTGIGAADIDPRFDAQKGKVILPSGKICSYEMAQKNPKWVTVLGMRPVDIKEPRNRCLYNIRSAVWAGKNFNSLYILPSARTRATPDDVDSAEYVPIQGKKLYPVEPKAVGDKFICNTCSAQHSCSYFRDGAVCSVPGSEPVELSKYFNTRDSGQIITGLGTLMAIQTRRLEDGLANEELEGLDPNVTKLINSLFDRGVTLAKLVDPGLRDPKLAINVGKGGLAAVIGGSPQQMIASVVSALEAKGVARSEITPGMIENLLESMKLNGGDPHRAIEGTVVARSDQRAV